MGEHFRQLKTFRRIPSGMSYLAFIKMAVYVHSNKRIYLVYTNTRKRIRIVDLRRGKLLVSRNIEMNLYYNPSIQLERS